MPTPSSGAETRSRGRPGRYGRFAARLETSLRASSGPSASSRRTLAGGRRSTGLPSARQSRKRCRFEERVSIVVRGRRRPHSKASVVATLADDPSGEGTAARGPHPSSSNRFSSKDRGPELGAEVGDRAELVLGEDVGDDTDVRVRVERDVHVRRRDEIDGRRRARRATDREPERVVTRGEQAERGRRRRPGHILEVAEEAPRPRPTADVRGGDRAQLDGELVGARRHQVDVRALLRQPQRRPVEGVVARRALRGRRHTCRRT